MNQLAKDKLKWRKKLLQFYEDNGITRCEVPGCYDRLGLAPAHRVKQRYILTEEEYMRAALLCQGHHHFFEYGDNQNPGTHERMRELIDYLIEIRNGYN